MAKSLADTVLEQNVLAGVSVSDVSEAQMARLCRALAKRSPARYIRTKSTRTGFTCTLVGPPE